MYICMIIIWINTIITQEILHWLTHQLFKKLRMWHVNKWKNLSNQCIHFLCRHKLTILFQLSFQIFNFHSYVHRFYKKGKQLIEEPVEDISKGHTKRLTSSNYKPFNAWVYGAQMVAFNMQVCSFLILFSHRPFQYLPKLHHTRCILYLWSAGL